MASTYTTGFGIEKIGSGEQSGAWGTTTNHNLDILDRIASYKAVALSGTTHTLTVREASPGSGTENLQDGMYRVIKFTGALGGNNTVTIAPNTAPAYFIFENATTDSGSSGPYSVILTQGSGANITIQNGKNAIVYCDGAGSGAAVVNALSDLQIATLEVTGVATATTFEPDGDTAAGDNAAIGYTAAEGLILTGQGSTSDITFKNDADATVFTVPTGTDDILFPDSAKAMFGAGSDLQIYHNGSNSYIDDTGTGNLYIQSNGTQIILQPTTGESGIVIDANAAVNLYHNNIIKLATAASGLSVIGSATFAATNGSTDTTSIDLGSGRSGNGYSFIDLIGDATYTDYGLRLIRNNGGANTTSSLRHRGTGTLTLECAEAADMSFETTNVERMRILSGGNVGIGTTAPTGLVTAIGTLGTHFIASQSQANDTAKYGAYAIPHYHNAEQNLGLVVGLSNGTDNTVYMGGGVGELNAATVLSFNTAANDATVTGTERMRITSAGNVGINKAAPVTLKSQKTLQVLGNAKLGSANDTGLLSLGDVTSNDANAGIWRGAAGAYAGGGNYLNLGGYSGITFTTGAADISSQTERMRIDASGYVGIGKTPTSKSLEIYAASFAGIRIQNSTTGTGSADGFLLEQGGADILLVNYEAGNMKFLTSGTERMSIASGGTVNVVGTFTAGTKTFRIAHPLPEKNDTHYLLHSSIEGPQADLIYRGRADLVSGGTVDVNIDTAAGMTEGTFDLLCGDVQCFTSNEDGWTALKGSVTGNVLTITAQDNTCTDTVSWMVIGERKDAKMIESEWADNDGKLIVETLKSEHE